MGDDPDHGLAVQLDHEAQHAVRRRVLRPDVDQHVLAGIGLHLPVPLSRAHSRLERDAHRAALRVQPRGRELDGDGPLAHSE